MAYAKRVPAIKLCLNRTEFNILIGVLTENIEIQTENLDKEIAINTKEKLLKHSLPVTRDDGLIEIDLRMYLNEAVDLITQLLLFSKTKLKNIDYYQLLLKVRENIEKKDNKLPTTNNS